MLDRRFTCVRLSHPYLTWSIHAFDHNVHHRGHCAAAACGSLKPLPAERLRGTFPHLSYSMKLALLLGTTEGPTLISLAASHPPSVGVFAAHVVVQFAVMSLCLWYSDCPSVSWTVELAPHGIPIRVRLGEQNPVAPS